MSRSKHTDPRSIRAARRIRVPFEPRAAGDLGLRRRLGPMLKELNGIVVPDREGIKPGRLRPRVILRQPSPGFHHPVEKQEVLQLLEAVGPLALYGLRLVELAHARAPSGGLSLVFGRYQVPGRILLFEQPLPPWRLRGLLGEENIRRFERAGAVVNLLPELGATQVDWPTDTLRRFMLEEVLLHELGHHVLQQYKAKRQVRIARTKDHEGFAARFAARKRLVLPEKRT